MIPEWVGKWVGKEYADQGRGPKYDCYGLARAIYQDQYGITLPDYTNAYKSAEDAVTVCRAFSDGLKTGWERLQGPRVGALAIIRIAGRPWHCGVVVAPDAFIHQPDTDLSRIERLDRPAWARRVEGFWLPIDLSGRT